MSSIARVTGALDRTAELMKSTMELLFYAAGIFVLLSGIGLVGAGVFGIVHDGDDFGVDLGSGGSRESDVIVLPHLP